MKLKIGVVGPSGAGKSTVANLLANEGFGENANSHLPYRPTHSIRIVEFSVPNIELTKYSMEVDVQLWEMGGNPRLKPLWTGMQNNVDGIILVYDVNNETHVRDASAFYMHFVTHAPTNISPTQCLIVGNIFRGQRESGVQKIVGIGQRVRHIAVNIDDDGSYLREEFVNFLRSLAQIIFDREKANMMMTNTPKSASRFRPQDFRCRTRLHNNGGGRLGDGSSNSSRSRTRPTRPVTHVNSLKTRTDPDHNNDHDHDHDRYHDIVTRSSSGRIRASPRKRSATCSSSSRSFVPEHNGKNQKDKNNKEEPSLNSIIEKLKEEIRKEEEEEEEEEYGDN